MLILPHSVELGVDKRPYVTFLIVILCVIIHYYQYLNRYEIRAASTSYCDSIYDSSIAHSSLDLRSVSPNDCQWILETMHSVPDKELVVQWFEVDNNENQEYSEAEFKKVIKALRAHYTKFSVEAPLSLDTKLEYDPSTLNPIRSITSAVSHADWAHLIRNLVFFLVFASVVEIKLQSAIQYIAFTVAISIITALAYSISAFIDGDPIPTLGLSGVVMGMMGLSAYLMPNAKIKTFVWFLIVGWNFCIPAWVLAVGYIGWDIYELFAYTDDGSTNLKAHISGGIAGYLIGYFGLKQRRERIREELGEEMEDSPGLCADRLGALSSDRSGR